MTGELRALEFFAGIGLARMGLERAGFRVVFANDIDPKKLQMHEGHWGPDPSYHLGDVFELEASTLPDAELAWASFPCVDLSLAGNRAGLNGKSSGAYWGFYRLLESFETANRPSMVVLENVAGMLTSRGGADLRVILDGLNNLGYAVDVLSIDAARFVPQSRPRLFVVAATSPGTLPNLPVYADATRSEAVLRFRAANPDVRWGTLQTEPVPARFNQFRDVAERFPDNSDIWWDSEATDKLVGQMSARHRQAVESLAARPEINFGTVYRRVRSSGCMAEVRLDGVAGCLRTPRGGSSRQFVVELGFGRIRARHMTAVEYGRLQGAGDFRIRVPFNQALYGFGDAVAVPVVEWLGRQCRAALVAAGAEGLVA